MAILGRYAEREPPSTFASSECAIHNLPLPQHCTTKPPPTNYTLHSGGCPLSPGSGGLPPAIGSGGLPPPLGERQRRLAPCQQSGGLPPLLACGRSRSRIRCPWKGPTATTEWVVGRRCMSTRKTAPRPRRAGRPAGLVYIISTCCYVYAYIQKNKHGISMHHHRRIFVHI